MNILLTGATGFIGSHCLSALVTQNHQLSVYVRNSSQLECNYPQVKIQRGDFSKMSSITDWLPLLENIEVVINCIGIIAENKQQQFIDLHQYAPIALFKACEKLDVKKVIQISALGADDKAQSSYHLTKKAADDVLQSLNLAWFILRSSIVYGNGAQSMALFHAFAALPILPLIEKGQQRLQPVAIDDLIATILVCLDSKTQGKRVLNVVGFEAISFQALLTQLRLRLQMKAASSFSLPQQLIIPIAKRGQWLGIPALSIKGVRVT